MFYIQNIAASVDKKNLTMYGTHLNYYAYKIKLAITMTV